MDENWIARASVVIDASRVEVWDALVDPEAIEQYMFGTAIQSIQPTLRIWVSQAYHYE